jgi:hypothetical protein
MFAGSGAGLILLAFGQTVVVVCACFDMVRALSVPRSHRRYVASTVFRTLAIPSIIAAGMSALIAALSWSWTDVKKLARWSRRQFSSGTRVAPAMG